MARRIYDVDAIIIPLAGGSRCSNSDAPFFFLGHPVHHRGAIMDFAYLVGPSRKEQDPFCNGGLAGIYMSNKTYIPYAIHGQLLNLIQGDLITELRKEHHQR
jgi:hypothetical protein